MPHTGISEVRIRDLTATAASCYRYRIETSLLDAGLPVVIWQFARQVVNRTDERLAYQVTPGGPGPPLRQDEPEASFWSLNRDPSWSQWEV
jgi:hypothetical protein